LSILAILWRHFWGFLLPKTLKLFGFDRTLKKVIPENVDNIVRTTPYWKNIHQVHSNAKAWTATLGARKQKRVSTQLTSPKGNES